MNPDNQNRGSRRDDSGLCASVKGNNIPGSAGQYKFQCAACKQTMFTGTMGEGSVIEAKCQRRHCHHVTRFVCPVTGS